MACVARRDLLDASCRAAPRSLQRRARHAPARCVFRDAEPARETGCRSRSSRRSSGTIRATSFSSSARGNVTMPASDRWKPMSRARLRHLAIAGEAVEHAARRRAPASSSRMRNVSVLGLARVDHDRQLAAVGPAGSARERPAAGRRAARSRSGSRGRSPRPPARAAARRWPTAPDAPPPRDRTANFPAACGCTPIENRTSSQRARHRARPRKLRPRLRPPRMTRRAARRRAWPVLANSGRDVTVGIEHPPSRTRLRPSVR